MNNQQIKITCHNCSKNNIFDQPYPYHAGFSEQGFLYSESGIYTLVWSWYDPIIPTVLPQGWKTNLEIQQNFEKQLKPAPDGTSWNFKNPARCTHCSSPIASSILNQIYYFVYPNSIILTDKTKELKLSEQFIQTSE